MKIFRVTFSSSSRSIVVLLPSEELKKQFWTSFFFLSMKFWTRFFSFSFIFFILFSVFPLFFSSFIFSSFLLFSFPLSLHPSFLFFLLFIFLFIFPYSPLSLSLCLINESLYIIYIHFIRELLSHIYEAYVPTILKKAR